MALNYYELSSYHPDPEWHLEPFDPDPTKHSVNMPEHVARLLQSLQVQQGLDDYDMGITPEENYEIHRVDDDYVVPF